jgi:hypothetical protein
MSDNVMLKIGDVNFGLSGPAYDKFTHEIEANWASQGRINRNNALQFVGLGPEKITISGVIFPLLNTGGGALGAGTLKKIESSLRSPGPQMVIDGMDRRYGYFIVRSLKEDRSKFLTNGAPQKQEFTVVLERYGEDMLRDDAVLGEGNTDISGIRSSSVA